jgi:dTDP-glucose 4,6-dehydratase
MRVLITGGAGFIGSQVTKHFVGLGHEVCVADRFTYAGKGKNLAPVSDSISILYGDLATGNLAKRCAEWQPDWVVHMAAETHVDHAIDRPESFMWSNAHGTTRLLQAFYEGPVDDIGIVMPERILVYSTDEVFGSTPRGECFDELTPYNPSNAYSASKVAVEAIVNSFFVTHDMPVMVVRPCNTYGPRQHPEKVIPKFVGQMLRGEPVTVYNDGQGARDWLHVEDHARAVACILEKGIPGESYNLAAGEEHTDLEIAERIQANLFQAGLISNSSYETMIKLTPGRPGHDRRYWMDGSKLRTLGWKPEVPFTQGFKDTVLWNAQHQDHWADDVIRLVKRG